MSLSKLRQCFLSLLQSGLALTLLAAHSVIADQDGNSLPYRECFESTARTYNLDRDWLTAIAIVESSLNPKAVSSANAVGLMQIKWPQTAAHLAHAFTGREQEAHLQIRQRQHPAQN